MKKTQFIDIITTIKRSETQLTDSNQEELVINSSTASDGILDGKIDLTGSCEQKKKPLADYKLSTKGSFFIV